MKLLTLQGTFTGRDAVRLALPVVDVPPGKRLVVELTGEIFRYVGLRPSAWAEGNQPVVEVWEFGHLSHWLKQGLYVANAHFVEDDDAV